MKFFMLPFAILVCGFVALGNNPSRAQDHEGGGGLQGFKPQTQREALLYQTLLELQREVKALRREVQSLNPQKRPRDGEGGGARREGEAPPRVDNAQLSKFRKQFQTYDKNSDGRVSLEERLAMRNYEVTGARLLNERLYHLHEDMNRDGGVSLEEFAAARTRKGQRWLQFQLQNIDVERKLIQVKAGRGEGGGGGDARAIRVEPKAIISVQGREARLNSLQVGQPVYLFMSHDQQSAVGITQR